MSKKILIIDDEPDIVDLMKMRLEASNYTVLTAYDGLDGIAALEAERPDLVILDVMMPNLDGHVFVRVIKKYDELKGIPILIFTAKTELQDIFEVEGVKHYLVKPFDPNILLEKVKILLKEDS